MTADHALRPASGSHCRAEGGRLTRADGGRLTRAVDRLAAAWDSRLRRIRRIAERIQRGKAPAPGTEKSDKDE
jgi:succinate dehydrogenase/fumarate reductase flavoprotein subunit